MRKRCLQRSVIAAAALLAACAGPPSNESPRSEPENPPGESAETPPSSGDQAVASALSLGAMLAEAQAAAREGDPLQAQGLRAVAETHATHLGIELPAEELDGSFDPHAAEIRRRLAARLGEERARYFAFSYHAAHAELLCAEIAKLLRAPPRLFNLEGLAGMVELIELDLEFHAGSAAAQARALGLPPEIPDEGRKILEQVRRLKDAPLAGKKRAYEGLAAKLLTWRLRVAARVPPEVTRSQVGAPHGTRYSVEESFSQRLPERFGASLGRVEGRN